ncbi:MAG: hypothetical protein CM1200mP41_08290 [Gammaproteobacteria bacterium]|nr:MAG: hypothetical protein CM1200mP41_08290 [Gammaproteobacteria bacterium]
MVEPQCWQNSLRTQRPLSRMKFKDLRSPFSNSTYLIEVDSYAIVGTSSLLTVLQWQAMTRKGCLEYENGCTALTTSFEHAR